MFSPSGGQQKKIPYERSVGKNNGSCQNSQHSARATKDSPQTAAIVERIKELEHEGYQFEMADASFELVVLHILNKFKPHFKLNMYKQAGISLPDGEMSAYAMLKIEVDGAKETVAFLGNGPVNALDQALRKALSVFYPSSKSAFDGL